MHLPRFDRRYTQQLKSGVTLEMRKLQAQEKTSMKMRGSVQFLMAVLVFASVGCQQTRSSLQMDSDGRMPFLNVAVPIRDRGQNVEPRVLESSENTPSESRAIQTLEHFPAETNPNRWTGWLDRLRTPAAIPLPRTDIDDQGEILELPAGKADSILEF